MELKVDMPTLAGQDIDPATFQRGDGGPGGHGGGLLRLKAERWSRARADRALAQVPEARRAMARPAAAPAQARAISSSSRWPSP